MHRPYSDTNMISVEEALTIILTNVSTMPTEEVALTSCAGRVLAIDVSADMDIAHFAASCMDGFAVNHSTLASATPESPVTLPIAGVIGAGTVYSDKLDAQKALRIMTGAPVPDGATAVVKIESTSVSGVTQANQAGTEVTFFAAPEIKANIRDAGEEAKAGQLMMRARDLITPAAVGLLASCGCTEVKVYQRPRVAIFSTGTELVEPSKRPGPEQIRNTNSYALAAQATSAGAIATIMPPVKDTLEAFCETLLSAVEQHDLVVLSGGAAEGDFDYTTRAIRELGELFFNKVCMRPGKAQVFGMISGIPVFGLAGNPAAAAVGFEILLRPAIRKMQGLTLLNRPITRARLTRDLKKKEPRRFYLRASLSKDEHDSFIVTPADNQSSALYRTLYEGNCLLVIPEDSEPGQEGKTYDCLRLDLPEGALI